MKKKVLSILLAFFAIATTAQAQVVLNETNFPDANFRAALVSILKINEGEEVTAEKIAATTELDIRSKSISNLTGIEFFTALTSLNCYGNQLTSLDVSKNTALNYLNCWFNQLTSLDLSKNTALTSLYCQVNQLSSLDVSKNTKLDELYCWRNRLTSLDVSKNIGLWNLNCSDNQLTALDVSKNLRLGILNCSINQLSTLDVSKNTGLIELRCNNNKLSLVDVSKNVELLTFFCTDNQLMTLDVSKNIVLRNLNCGGNHLALLDLSNNVSLRELSCFNNKLNSLNVSKNTILEYLSCYSNKIRKWAMDELVESLPTMNKRTLIVIDTKDENEGNICTKAQVAMAKGKGWITCDYDGNNGYDGMAFVGYPEYEGSDLVDENDNVDFTSDIEENDYLNGNVIGDIYYNINTGNGGYNAAEGCIVVTKPTDDGTVNGLEGKDIFSEDFKSQFTGIVFKAPAGKGTIKVNAETTGSMTLKVKIGSNDPVEMELDGKLKVTFPYNVSEPTYVYIYAGAANEAKGFGNITSTESALKIYGIEFLRGETSIDNLQSTINNLSKKWHTIDGKKLNGEPTMKGVYVVNGRKVVK